VGDRVREKWEKCKDFICPEWPNSEVIAAQA
jgi:hypothetical protein